MSALFPIISSTFPPAMEFVPALLIGLLFGIALEVAGFGNARVLAGQFYFHDMRVFKVMFTAIVTASTGVAILAAAGLLDMDLLYVPDTFIVPLLTGGFILGMGFMISAYCPGTSIVAAASGKWDGIMTVIGVIVGSVIFGMIQPAVEDFYMSTAKGVLTFPKLLGVSFPVLALALAFFAFLLFLGADRLEGIFAQKFGMPEGVKMTRTAKKTFIAVMSLSVLAVIFQFTLPSSKALGTSERISSITPIELGQMLVEDPRSLYVVDLREGNVCKGTGNIPLAVCFSDIRNNLEFMYKGNTMVVFSQEGKKRLPEALFKYTGRIVSLEGGYDAWRTTVMGKPEQAYQIFLNASDRSGRNMISALHALFTGAKMEAQAESAKPGAIIAKPKKKSGGCL
jgi:uncharacterized protein